MFESQDSDENESKVKVKAIKRQFNPNVTQFKTHFIPGTAFESKSDVIETQSYVRKRKKCFKENRSQETVESIDGNDSDDTIVDEEYNGSVNWRSGPAKYWYDLIGLADDCVDFDYGLKLRSNCLTDNNSKPRNGSIDSEDAFNLVSQISWETDVIWDPDVVRQKVLKKAEKPSIAGWLPIDDNRRAPEFVRLLDNQFNSCDKNNDISVECVSNESNNKSKTIDKTKNKTKCETNGAINRFSKRRRKVNPNICDNNEDINEKLPKIEVSSQWVTTLPEENRDLIINRWEDEIIWDTEAMDRIPVPKIIPFSGDDNNAVIYFDHNFDENSNDSTVQLREGFKVLDLDFNISNDEFYASIVKVDSNVTHGLIITHSIPAKCLNSLCFPSCVQDFEKPLLKRSKTLVSKEGNEVFCCENRLEVNENPSENDFSLNVKDLSEYRINSLRDLTAITGDIVLMEYSEEDPPFLMRVGMGSKITKYFKKTKDKASTPVKHKYAETKCVSNSPFIGDIGSGESQLSLETNMFRSPIFEHNCPETDFLVIISNKRIYIREINGLFVVGQELSRMEVPRPKSKSYFDFIKQFSKMFIYRYFNGRQKVKDLDKEMKKWFPNVSSHFISNILKTLTFRQNEFFLLKSNIPFENQINNLLTPEDCCAYYSTLIAGHKLRGRGYGDRLYLEETNEEKDCDELAIAPWNTTVSYIGSINNKKWLNLSDINSDGSLVFSNQSYKDFKDRMPTIKRCQPLSSRSLQRLDLKRGHEWLINYGLSRDKVRKIKNLKECRDKVKDLSEKLRQNGVTIGLSKTRTTEQHYKLECQKIYDLHTSYYSSVQDYSTDEEDDEEEEENESDSDMEEMGQRMQIMMKKVLDSNKTWEQIEFEIEEEERKEWLNSLKGIKDPKPSSSEKRQSFKGKVLKITRVYERNGKKFTNTEIIRNRRVIEPYVRIRETKTEDFIRQLSFVKNIAENGKSVSKTKPKSKPIPIPVVNEKLKKMNGVLKPIVENTSVSDQTVNGFNGINIDDDNDWDITESSEQSYVATEALVSVDGSKLKFSKSVVEKANNIRTEEEKRQKEIEEEETRWTRTDYFTPRSTRRCRIDPMVQIITIFDDIIVNAKKLKELEECIEFFINPVKEREYPDYYDIINTPIDLKTIRRRVKGGRYPDRQSFLKDIQLIYDNSLEYNGSESDVTIDAQKLVQYCTNKLKEREEELNNYEVLLTNDEFYQKNKQLFS